MPLDYGLAKDDGRHYERWQKKLAPPDLQRDEGGLFLGAFGAMKDELVARAKEATKASFPALGPPDALPRIGADVMIERGIAETEASYRRRLMAAHDAWRWAGTEIGILGHVFAPSGLTNAALIGNSDWIGLGSVPPDGSLAAWSRIWLVIAQPHPWADDGLWADDSEWGEGGSPGLWGTDAGESDVSTLKRLIRSWTGAHATCMGVWIVLDAGDVPTPDARPAAPWSPAMLTFGGRSAVFWPVEG